MNSKPKVIVYLYNQFFDPLIQGNIFLYLKDLVARKEYNLQLALITFERPEFLKSRETINKLKSDLAAKNISWYPLTWHPGTSLVMKFVDLFSGFLKIVQLRLSGFDRLISLGSVAGSYAFIISFTFRLKLYLYQYEPHSEYEVDSGTYGKESLKFKTLNYLEKRSARYASVISSGTHHMMDRLKAWNVRAKFFKIPSVANEEKFIFSNVDRLEIRKQFGIPEDKIILLYPGKFGGLYYREETARMFSILLGKNAQFHAFVVTPHDVEEIKDLFLRCNVPETRLTITQAGYDSIHKFYSAADFGIIAVPPGPSKKFVSNIKVGEYLCSGLPYLICKGISEDDEYAEKEGVGVVIRNFDQTEIEGAYESIREKIQADREVTRKHCREVGIAYRGFKKLNQEFRKAFAALLAA